MFTNSYSNSIETQLIFSFECQYLVVTNNKIDISNRNGNEANVYYLERFYETSSPSYYSLSLR